VSAAVYGRSLGIPRRPLLWFSSNWSWTIVVRLPRIPRWRSWLQPISTLPTAKVVCR